MEYDRFIYLRLDRRFAILLLSLLVVVFLPGKVGAQTRYVAPRLTLGQVSAMLLIRLVTAQPLKLRLAPTMAALG